MMSVSEQEYIIDIKLVQRAKEAFKEDMKHIRRANIDRVIHYLEKESDFLIAPASTQYHLCCSHGLLVHSYHVSCYLKELCEMPGIKHIKISPESILICSWFHDICKVNVYKPFQKFVKDDRTNRWNRVLGYKFEDNLPLGHGEKSVFVLNSFGLKLEIEEIAAINYHMGAFHFSGKFEKESSMQQAWEKWPISLLLHTADSLACKIADVGAIKENRK